MSGRYGGWWPELVTRVGWHTRERAVQPLLRRFAPITTHELVTGTGGVLSTKVEELLIGLFPESPAWHAHLSAEFVQVRARLDQADESTRGHPDRYPDEFRVEGQTAYLLYCLVRLGTPGVVAESGVANGHSSFVILEALARNGKGQLHSLEVNPAAGCMVPDRLRGGWTLHVLPAAGRKRAVGKVMAGLGNVDLFIHDSLHRYHWQTAELEAAWSASSAGSLIASDDADSSHAFADFCRRHALSPCFLFDERKVFGISRRT